MPLESVGLRMAAAKGIDQMSKRQLTALVGALVDALRAVTAKLDADAGVTDTNYTAVVDGIVKK